MREDKRAERAEQIEHAAYRVLEKKGYSGLSMLSVAREARASNETLYRWYGDKLGLFKALIARNTEIVRDRMKQVEGKDAIETLLLIGPELLWMLLGRRAVALNRAAAADQSGTLGTLLREIGRDTVGPWIMDLMERGRAEGHFHGTDIWEMAETYFALLIGDLQIRRVTGAVVNPPPEDKMAKRSNRAVGQFLKIYGKDHTQAIYEAALAR